MTVAELSWLVGFYEGEGSCGCYTYTIHRYGKVYRPYALSASISQKNLCVIKLIQKLIGYGNINVMKRSGINKITMFRWKVTNQKARNFLTKILPHMKHPDKIKQIKKALKLDKLKVRS